MGLPVFYQEVSVSDSNSEVVIDFSGGSNPTPASEVTLIEAAAGDDVYFAFQAGVADTNDAVIKAGESFTFVGTIDEVNLICDTGETATVRVYATP